MANNHNKNEREKNKIIIKKIKSKKSVDNNKTKKTCLKLTQEEMDNLWVGVGYDGELDIGN